ncbi:DNA polymerase-3 subunit epsilon [Lipingzhangella halophila]|uniref:DNA polymerase-3 subunit epsilon n=1 Tax=Lipingzhangella halophila TaxID=1783352 RepID=A0A7W7RPA7_9ACTN|nr:exonuclease domain-containing protein [Lipingzhangella halophila]MBB4935680.1 DNA polymerase-3 subunit epsilon [Lipingzhangella halophila]
MSWHTGLLSSVDAETTGVDVETDRIVTWSRWTIRPSRGYKRCCTWLVDPGVDIPDGATAIHGVTTEHARQHGERARDAIPAIAADVLYWSREEGAVTVAYNAAYDITLLHRECLRYGRQDLADQLAALRPVVDPTVLDKQCDTFRKGSRKLGDVARHYGIDLAEQDAHGSAADALAAARVAYVIATRYPALGGMEPGDLHDRQVTWRADQCASLQRYLRKKDPPDTVVDPHWPLTPVPVVTQEALT